MRTVEYYVTVGTLKYHDRAIVLDGEDPVTAMIEAAIELLGTDVIVKCGGVSMHLAAWQDHDHWSEDWEEAGVDPAEHVAAQVKEE